MPPSDPVAAATTVVTETSSKRGRKPGAPKTEKPVATSVKIPVELGLDSDELRLVDDYCSITGATRQAAIKLALVSLGNPVELIQQQLVRQATAITCNEISQKSEPAVEIEPIAV